MRSLVLCNTILCLWAALSRASAETVLRNTKETILVPSDPWRMVVKDDIQRSLQTAAVLYRATWGTLHTGTCANASVPAIIMNCTGGAAIALSEESNQANCNVRGASEIFCSGSLGEMFYSTEFTCTGTDLGASAILLSETEDCLGGTPEVGSWVHGVQIFLLCGAEPQAVGDCYPIESLGPNNACSLGYSCETGNCRDVDLVIPTISSVIDDADVGCLLAAANDTGVPTAKPTTVGVVTDAPTSVPTAKPTNVGAVTDAPTNSSAPTSTPAPSMDESTSMRPSMEDDAIDSTKPPTSKLPTSEPSISGSNMNKLTLASTLVTATTMFVIAGNF